MRTLWRVVTRAYSARGGAVARRSIIFSDADLSGPNGKTLPLLAKASWLSLVEPTLRDKLGLTSFRLKLTPSQMSVPPAHCVHAIDWIGVDWVSIGQ